MNRELVDFYIQNNYSLNENQDYRNVCQTILDRYRVLNAAISNLLNTGLPGRQRQPLVSLKLLSMNRNVSRYSIIYYS
jgi:hypothetical protein